MRDIISVILTIALFGLGIFYNIFNFSTLKSIDVTQYISSNYIYVYIMSFVLTFISFIHFDKVIKQVKKEGRIISKKEIDYIREIPDYINLETAYASLYYHSKINKKYLKNRNHRCIFIKMVIQ